MAVFICVVISKVARLEFTFFVAIAAIISMENSLTNSIKAGKNRMAGTFIGAVIGLIGALIKPGSAIICGLRMIAVIYFCNLLRWRKPISIAGVVFIAIMVSLGGKNPVQYSINRILDTFIGITVAVVVNYLFFPPDYIRRIRRIITELIAKTEQILYHLFIDGQNVGLIEYEQELAKGNELLELSCADSKLRKLRNAEEIPGIQKAFGALNRIAKLLVILSQMNPGSNLNESGARELQKSFGWEHLHPGAVRDDETSIVFNYHLREILTLYHSLKQTVAPNL